MPTKKSDKLDPLRKAAILISALDHRVADALLERMSEEQAALVRQAAMELDSTSGDVQDSVVREFLRTGEYTAAHHDSGIELDDELARKLASPGSYSEMRESPARSGQPPFRFLHEATVDAVAKHLAHENPQAVAMVIAHLPPERAAAIVLRFEARFQADVLRRVAQLDTADPEIVREVEQHLESLLADDVRDSKNRAAGLSTVASILQAAGGQRRQLLSRLHQYDQQLASQLKAPERVAMTAHQTTSHVESPTGETSAATHSRRVASQPASLVANTQAAAMSTTAAPPESVTIHFDDLAQLDDRALAKLFHAADSGLLLLALTGAAPEFVDRLLKQLPAREAKVLQHRLEHTGPLRLTDIEEAQARLARLAGLLAARGELELPKPRRFTMAA